MNAVVLSQCRPMVDFVTVNIGAALKPIMAKNAILCADSMQSMGCSASEIGVANRPIYLAAGVVVVAGVCHVQSECLR